MGARRFFECFIGILALISSAQCLNFKWSAAIERSTGIATSRESSRAPSSCSLYRAVDTCRMPARLMENVFGRYPTWLASWRVTFWCLRAVPVTNGIKNKQLTEIRDALFGVTLLSFAPGHVHVRKSRHTEYTMVMPIAGGLFALPSPEGAYGSLSFSLRREGGGSDDSLTLHTTISDGYRPTIAGSAPVSFLRAGLYRSTQSLIHAYVMWRFHHYCYHQSE